ncbi:MAG: hypothetical protein APF82_07060 [Sphingomonadales bacterium BRH_c42]|nr:MAG: hypothetical protein APF82_07060 [Sphingomonadales bacterium BRH_c42]
MIRQMLGLGLLGFVGYKLLKPKDRAANAAYADGQPHDYYTEIRDAGPQAMRDPPQGEWTEIDENLDESFPASDPPGGY